MHRGTPGCLIGHRDAARGNSLAEDKAPELIARGEEVLSRAGYLAHLCERAAAKGCRVRLSRWTGGSRATASGSQHICRRGDGPRRGLRCSGVRAGAVLLDKMSADLDATSREMLANVRTLPIMRAAAGKTPRDALRRGAGKLPQEQRAIMDLAWLRRPGEDDGSHWPD